MPKRAFVIRCEYGPEFSSITNTVPEAFQLDQVVRAKIHRHSVPRWQKNSAKIYLPPGHNAKQKYPMVIFVHGAGYLQNVINGWNNYYREFMFNEMLTQKGYVVLDIDYRGSAGYGRDWRTDVYDFLRRQGLRRSHRQPSISWSRTMRVNQSKIGVYGGSYGGFMAAMLATRAPDKIAAAAALRPVMDWKNYYAANPDLHRPAAGISRQEPGGIQTQFADIVR